MISEHETIQEHNQKSNDMPARLPVQSDTPSHIPNMLLSQVYAAERFSAHKARRWSSTAAPVIVLFAAEVQSASLGVPGAAAAAEQYVSAGFPTELHHWLLNTTLGAYLCADGCGALAAPHKQIAAASLVKLLS